MIEWAKRKNLLMLQGVTPNNAPAAESTGGDLYRRHEVLGAALTTPLCYVLYRTAGK